MVVNSNFSCICISWLYEIVSRWSGFDAVKSLPDYWALGNLSSLAENLVAKLLGNFYSRFLSGVISMIISCKLTNLDIFFYLIRLEGRRWNDIRYIVCERCNSSDILKENLELKEKATNFRDKQCIIMFGDKNCIVQCGASQWWHKTKNLNCVF